MAGADGMMPITEVSPFLYCIRVCQTLRLTNTIQGLHDDLGIGYLPLKDNRVFVSSGYGYQIFELDTRAERAWFGKASTRP